MFRNLSSIFFFVSALASAQPGGISADFAGRVVLFVSTARLPGEADGSIQRIFAFENGETRVVSESPRPLLGPASAGVSALEANDHGDLHAYSFWSRTPTKPFDFTGLLSSTGVVRHERDGWEISRPGLAGLSRDGRWALFASGTQGSLIDLWTSEEAQLSGTGSLSVASVADDGSVIATGLNSLTVYSPFAPPREIPLAFAPLTAMLDRTARFAAVYSSTGDLWRVDLSSGQAESWLRRCLNCQILSIADSGAALLYQEWSWIVLIREPGSGPVRISREGLAVDSATLTGDGSFAIALTADGIAHFDLETLKEETLLSGPTSFIRQPPVVAPGMWVRQEGRGLAAAEIKLNGASVPSLRRSSADIVWIVPSNAPLGSAQLEIAQPGSPFQPNVRSIDIQRAAPFFVTQAVAGIGNSATLDWPIIRHAGTGLPVLGLDAARPGESITVVMTGLNDQASAIEWTLTLRNTAPLYRLTFESAEPSPENANWTIVRLRMPGALPAGLSVLGAGYEKVQNNVLISTSDR